MSCEELSIAKTPPKDLEAEGLMNKQRTLYRPFLEKTPSEYSAFLDYHEQRHSDRGSKGLPVGAFISLTYALLSYIELFSFPPVFFSSS